MEQLAVYSISLGCPKNRVDTERLLGALGPGVRAAETPDSADLVLVNTCAFIESAVEESVARLLEVAGWADEAGDLGAARPPVVAAGCLVGRYGAGDLAPQMPEVDLWLAPADYGRWPEAAQGVLGRGVSGGAASSCADGADLPGAFPRLLSTPAGFAYLKLAEGCSHACSFCTIPAITGPYRSRPRRAVLDEARDLAARGVRELVLVAQDTSAWGRDLGEEHGLAGLLRDLAGIRGLEWIRCMYLYPAGITDRLLDVMAETGAPVLPYFDVPLQHAHPEVLARMGRPFARDPRRVVDRIRDRLPGASLRTSLITGFPGEGPEHFAALERFVKDVGFDHLGVFAWSPEEGTEAAGLCGRVDAETAGRRAERLLAEQRRISRSRLAGYQGEELDVLVEGPHPDWPGLFVGRTWFQAPEVDGITYVSGPGVATGQVVTARVDEAKTYDLVALAGL
jgi:tRNA-2-methylthio-N6-dimethylallyladenosine synthase/ribosomal protein S12 methylthiotransferase